jgi:hypothetical protein
VLDVDSWVLLSKVEVEVEVEVEVAVRKSEIKLSELCAEK